MQLNRFRLSRDTHMEDCIDKHNHTLTVNSHSNAAEAKWALKAGKSINPDDQPALLSFRFSLSLFPPVFTLFLSVCWCCFPSIVFSFSSFFTDNIWLFFFFCADDHPSPRCLLRSGWRSSSAGWALTTRSLGSSFISRWTRWGAVSASVTPSNSSNSCPEIWPHRRPTSCVCPLSTWRWRARPMRRVSLKQKHLEMCECINQHERAQSVKQSWAKAVALFVVSPWPTYEYSSKSVKSLSAVESTSWMKWAGDLLHVPDLTTVMNNNFPSPSPEEE